MTAFSTRRDFLRTLGIGAAAMPFMLNLPSLAFANQTQRKQRLILMFSPNGVVRKNFWPDEAGADFAFKEILQPLEPFRKQTLVLKGMCDKIRGDGDGHMRGIGCLLTGIELLPGNIQGGSDTPAGWSSGISIDQELKRHLQADPATKTRFGSLEYGVMVPDRADTWTRWSYAGKNQPITPIDDPYQMFAKMYGRQKDQETLRSLLDTIGDDLKKIRGAVSIDDRRLLDEHTTMVRELEQELRGGDPTLRHAVPNLEPGIKEETVNMPHLSKMQIELIVAGFAADFNRVATLQYTNSVGDARMKWLGVDEGHHALSHESNDKEDVQIKLTKINRWYAEQMAYLAKRLSETPEPGGQGSLLDNTTIVWTNELGEGNSHSQNDVPFVMVGGGLDFKMGRSIQMKDVPHNRLLMSFAHGFGHRVKSFGNPDYCGAGPIGELT